MLSLSDSPNPAFLEALREYEDELSDEDRAEFQRYAPGSASSLMKKVAEWDAHHAEKSDSRQLVLRVKKILDGIELFMNTTFICIQHDPHGSSLVVGAIRFILDVSSRCQMLQKQRGLLIYH